MTTIYNAIDKSTGEDIEIEVGFKQCSRDGCYAIKPLADFYKDKKSKDGHAAQCKACQKSTAKKNQKKTRSNSKRKKYNQARYAEKKDEIRAASRENYNKNKEVILEQQKVYRKTPKGKLAQDAGHSQRQERMVKQKGEPWVRAEIIELTSMVVDDKKIYICELCAEPMDLDDIHIDHIIPIAKGGLDCRTNVRAIHSTCNLTRPRLGDDDVYNSDDFGKLTKDDVK